VIAPESLGVRPFLHLSLEGILRDLVKENRRFFSGADSRIPQYFCMDSVKSFMKKEGQKMKPHPALAVPLVNAGRRQNLTTPCSCETRVQAENTEKNLLDIKKPL
jgi:hypothetical protein